MKKRFALIGAAGYIAPRHMDAIKQLGHGLVAAYDPFDSVGVIDRYAPDAAFFTEFERFDRHLEKLKRKGEGVDYVTVCSPNYLHDAHARFGLRLGADVICEKPLVLHERNATGLLEAEAESGQAVYCILQARLHPEAARLHEHIKLLNRSSRPQVNIDYITPRGTWYDYSWKGNESKSGGVATNIGVHLFDLTLSNFGEFKSIHIDEREPRFCTGLLILDRADVRFKLSVNHEILPDGSVGRRRVFNVDGEAFDLSGGFEDLHVKSYASILQGEGYRVADAIPAIRLVQAIREVPVGETITFP